MRLRPYVISGLSLLLVACAAPKPPQSSSDVCYKKFQVMEVKGGLDRVLFLKLSEDKSEPGKESSNLYEYTVTKPNTTETTLEQALQRLYERFGQIRRGDSFLLLCESFQRLLGNPPKGIDFRRIDNYDSHIG